MSPKTLYQDTVIVCEIFEEHNIGSTLSESAMTSVRRFVSRLGLDDVVEAMEIACYKEQIEDKPDHRFRYFCGICWNKIREKYYG